MIHSRVCTHEGHERGELHGQQQSSFPPKLSASQSAAMNLRCLDIGDSPWALMGHRYTDALFREGVKAEVGSQILSVAGDLRQKGVGEPANPSMKQHKHIPDFSSAYTYFSEIASSIPETREGALALSLSFAALLLRGRGSAMPN